MYWLHVYVGLAFSASQRWQMHKNGHNVSTIDINLVIHVHV